MREIIEKVAAAWRDLVGAITPTPRPALVPAYVPAEAPRPRR